jgi:hypothetical protein
MEALYVLQPWPVCAFEGTPLASSTRELPYAVGLAVASEHFAAAYNNPNFDNKIWCFTDDGCL